MQHKKVNLFNLSNSNHLQNVILKQNQTQSTGVLLTRFVQRISAHSIALHSAWTNFFFAHFRQIHGVGKSEGVEISHKSFGAKLSSSSTT